MEIEAAWLQAEIERELGSLDLPRLPRVLIAHVDQHTAAPTLAAPTLAAPVRRQRPRVTPCRYPLAA